VPRKSRLEQARELLDLHLPPGSLFVNLGRLGFGPWAMDARERGAADRRERAEKQRKRRGARADR